MIFSDHCPSCLPLPSKTCPGLSPCNYKLGLYADVITRYLGSPQKLHRTASAVCTGPLCQSRFGCGWPDFHLPNQTETPCLPVPGTSIGNMAGDQMSRDMSHDLS